MLVRLDWMTLKPSVILDVGCGMGEMATQLKERYQGAQLLAIDSAETMLQYAKKNYTLPSWICAQGEQLPLAEQTVDLIFAHFILPWHHNFTLLLREWRRVLRPDGLLLLTTLGPSTLQEWRMVFNENDLPIFTDLHDLGDALLHEGFADPVLDVSEYTLTYRDQQKLIYELHASAMWFPDDFIQAEKHIATVSPNAAGEWSVTYEVVYAHAFAPARSNEFSAETNGEVKIPLAHLRHAIGEK